MLRIILSTTVIAVFVALTAFDGAAVFADRGGTQGKSPSNPDGNGADKPATEPAAFGGAESQGPAYFDGNNGCGQDRRHDVAPDFQGGYDDNNGHCGKPAFAGQQAEARSHGKAHGAAQAAVKGAMSPPSSSHGGGVSAGVGAKGQASVSAPSAAVAGEVMSPPAASVLSSAVAAQTAESTAPVPAIEQPAPEVAPAAVPQGGGYPGSSDNWSTVLMTIAGLAMSAGAGLFFLKRSSVS